MATIAAQSASSVGAVLAFSAAAALGDKFANTGKELLLVRNASGSSVTLTVVTPKTVDGNLAVADRTLAIAAGGTAAIGPFNSGVYNDTDGFVGISYSLETSVTVAVVTQKIL